MQILGSQVISPAAFGNKSRAEPEEAPCHGARHSLRFLDCQAASCCLQLAAAEGGINQRCQIAPPIVRPDAGGREPARVGPKAAKTTSGSVLQKGIGLVFPFESTGRVILPMRLNLNASRSAEQKCFKERL